VKDRQLGYIFMAPTALTMLLVFFYPLLMSLWSSLHYDVFTQPDRYHFVGLQNYAVMLRNALFWNALRNSLIFFVTTVVSTMLLGTVIALLLDRDLGPLGWVKTLYLLPMVVAPVVVGIQWRFMLNDTFGVIPYLMRTLHLPTRAWLTEPVGAMVWLIAVDLWYYTPIVILLVSAGLATVPVEVREAAKLDGADALQTIHYVLLPILKPILIVALLIRTIGGVRAFDTIFVITEGGPGHATEVANLFAYKLGFFFFDMGKASAVAWMLLSQSSLAARTSGPCGDMRQLFEQTGRPRFRERAWILRTPR
jgi:multiple sugar transport system permease protein